MRFDSGSKAQDFRKGISEENLTVQDRKIVISDMQAENRMGKLFEYFLPKHYYLFLLEAENPI